ncbi:MAG: RecQ family ATP-dependent DNA helicase [Chitinophagales bacterium]
MKQPSDILLQYWGFSSFRPMQEDIIQSVLDGKDTLALLPTGGGKSICFQVPALCNDGICIVVSPLIALMKDQVYNLKERGIKAAAIFSGMHKRLIDEILDNCIYGDYKFLYVSPERLQTELFQARMKQMNVNLIAVDESHCISQWGYDFRPPYLQIKDVREFFPNIPILALTATATPDVVDDIQEKLTFKEKNVLQKSFLRSNLSYSVLYEDAKLTKLTDILHKVKGTAVVYARNRRKTKEIADYILKCGISADFYHAGLSNDERSRKQDNWINERTRVIVSTNAFGMGIDKANVRVVVHMDMPESLEAYFQEAGRAGRDGQKAYAVLLFNMGDKLKARDQLKATMPSILEIKAVYNALGNFFQLAEGSGQFQNYPFDISEFCRRYNFAPIKTHHALKFLEQNEYIQVSEGVRLPSRVKVKTTKEIIYKFQVENAAYEPLIKLLLRSFGGIFDGFAAVKESFLANKLKTTKTKIEKALGKLDELGILIYEKQNNKPFIQYLYPRVAPINLQLDEPMIEQRKQTFEKKLQSILHYASTKDNCRSNMLLNYFGEKRDDRCGVCDFCVGRNKLELSDTELENISQQIKNELTDKAHSLEYLVDAIPYNNKGRLLQVFHWMLDHEYLRKDGDKYRMT